MWDWLKTSSWDWAKPEYEDSKWLDQNGQIIKEKKSGEHFLILDISNAPMAGSRLVWENLKCLVA